MKMLGQGACSPDGDRSQAELCVTVPASPAAGATLRHAVRSLESFFDAGTAEEVELLVTELATNGVKHACATGANRITLDARVEDQQLHVAVSDRGAGFTHEPRSATRSEPGGWGLMLVESIADRWGVERDPTTVWFELAQGKLAA
jgi:anti-sigma regulatory factor (Ser/Thr protein kinase)